MKLCKDCKHIRSGDACGAPQNMRVTNPVDGGQKAHWFCCETHRVGFGTGIILRYPMRLCGKGARWFEPREESE